MSSELNVDVEILKLARLIDCDASGLDYLRGVEAQEIRDLREQVTVTMFEADRQMLQRVATAARLIPTKLAALIGERAFGPLLCARLTGLLEPSRAVDVAAKLPTPFLTDLAVQLDPRRASRVIAEIPPTQIADITRVLAEREEYIAMGGFVGTCPRRRCARRSPSSATRCSCARPTSSSPRAASPRSWRPCPTRAWSRSSRRRRGPTCGSRRSTCSAMSPRSSAASSATSRPARTTRCSTGWCVRRSASCCGTTCCRSRAR